MEQNHVSVDKIMVIRIVILHMNLVVCYVLRNKSVHYVWHKSKFKLKAPGVLKILHWLSFLLD